MYLSISPGCAGYLETPFLNTQTTRDLRRGNLKRLLRLVYFHEPISRLELAKRSGFSTATVANLVNQMIEQGLLEQAGLEQSKGGRPREILRIHRTYGYFVGIEVAETHMHAALYDIKLHPLAQVHYEINSEVSSPEIVADYVERSLHELQAQTGILTTEILAAGVGLPGIVHPTEGVSVFAPNWGWRNVPLRDMLHERLDIPFQVDNGFQALSLAEALFGAGRGVSEMAVVLIGTGVAAGLITRHQLWRGAANSAGEWGHTCVDPNGPLCRCGRRGCVEAFIGAPGIIRRVESLDPTSHLLRSGAQKTIVSELCAQALAGDPTATAVLDQVTHYLGLGIGNLVNLFNPSRVVLGGWCGNMVAPYAIPRLSQSLPQYALENPASIVDFRTSQMDAQGVSLGAACLVLETFLAGDLLSLFDNPA